MSRRAARPCRRSVWCRWASSRGEQAGAWRASMAGPSTAGGVQCERDGREAPAAATPCHATPARCEGALHQRLSRSLGEEVDDCAAKGNGSLTHTRTHMRARARTHIDLSICLSIYIYRYVSVPLARSSTTAQPRQWLAATKSKARRGHGQRTRRSARLYRRGRSDAVCRSRANGLSAADNLAWPC